MEVTVNHLKYKGRDVAYSFSKDISERKAAEREQAGLREQLFQSQKMETVGLLAGGVAHDFNNLLTPILGYSELMMLGRPEGDPNRKKLEHIHQAADLARVLTMRLLAFGRKQVLRLDVVDVGDIVRGLEPVIRRTIRENIRIETVVGGEPGLVRADKGQIEQALLNLAVNAQDAMPGEGTLTIEARNVDLDDSCASARPEVVPGPYVMLSVTRHRGGDGRGDPRPHLRAVLHHEGAGQGDGAGAGHRVRDREAARGVRHRVFREGARERVQDVPAAGGEGGEDGRRRSSPAAPDRAERGTETVLVAEDNETVRTLACRMLEDLGYRVLSAESADRCVALAGGHPEPIHLLLTDVIMPGKNGKELYDLLKRDRPGLKALYMSGYPGEVIGHHGILGEDVFFLQKPFTNAALAQQVRLALAG